MTAATLTSIQAAEIANLELSDGIFSGESNERIKHGSQDKSKKNYLYIIIAALIFISIISWFETTRRWVEYYYIPDETLYKICISYTVHATLVTLFTLIVFLLYINYWPKS